MIKKEIWKQFDRKNVLVTGGTGMIGRKVCDLLTENTNAHVVSVSLDRIQNLNEKVFYEYGDLSDFKELERKEKKSTKKLKQKEQLSYQQKKDEAREKRKLQNRINKLEKKIEKLEKELKQLDEKLADAEKFKELSQNPDFFSKYEQKQKKMKDLEQNWENMNLKLNTLNSHL